MLKGLYVISDDTLTPDETIYDDIKKALVVNKAAYYTSLFK